VADNVKRKMAEKKVKGSFGCGGITGPFVDMLEQGFFDTLFDVQCFDLRAVESIGKNLNHREISADLYANPFNRGSVVNMLDCVILSATEIDVNFNVNVNTESSGLLLHNTGGHCDTAAGAKLAIVVAPSIRGRLPIIRESVTSISTPGETVDVVVTERGIAVADRHPDLIKELARRRLPVKDIRQLHADICAITGTPQAIEFTDRVVAVIEYRDGSIIDVVRQVKD
jgi:citrate lyase subunit alpha/citrate CoA-transferase